MRKYTPLIVFVLAVATLFMSSKMRRQRIQAAKDAEFAVPAPVQPYVANTRATKYRPKKVEFKISKNQVRKKRLYERAPASDSKLANTW